MKRLILLSLLLCTQLPAQEQSFSIEPHFIGFNQPFAGQTHPWRNPALMAQLKASAAASFRYPAGTIGSYWNWQTGRLDETLDKTKVMDWVRGLLNGRGSYPPADLALPVSEAGIAPIWMLGMLVHTVDEYIAELKKAEAQGIPVRYIELGNELCFDRSEPLLQARFPTPEQYGEEATRWIQSLKAAFPQAKIAACGSFVSSPSQSERRRTWNPRMMKTLRGADAITFHLYVREILLSEQERAGLGEVAAQNQRTRLEREAQTITDEFATRTLAVAASVVEKSFALTQMPPGLDVWVTEWNPGGAGGTSANWLGGLVTAALLDAFIQQRVTLTVHHTMGDAFGAGGPRETGNALNTTGHALRLFAQATTGMTRATRLAFADHPGLHGWQFSDGETTRALVMNFTPRDGSPGGPHLAQFQHITQLSASPAAAAPEIKQTNPQPGPEPTLPAWSLTLLQ